MGPGDRRDDLRGGSSPTSLTQYRAGTYSGDELVAAVPALAEHAVVRVEQVANVGSPNITFDDWLTLARRINAIFAEDPDVAGVVITHGTNTLEETAYFLNLTVRHDRPVVLVGAQRPATAISADGPLNLLNAVRTAVAPEAVRDVRDAASLVNSGRVKPIIANLAPMQEANDAMESLRAGDPIGRIVLEW